MDEKPDILNIIGDTYDSSERPFDFLELGVETAALCESDPDRRQFLVDALKGMGYAVSEMKSADDALRQIYNHSFSVVVVNESFDNQNAGKILDYLGEIPISMRRNSFVILLGKNVRTMDKLAAFQNSVNLTINEQDLEKIGLITTAEIAEHKRVYSVFRDVLTKIGKG